MRKSEVKSNWRKSEVKSNCRKSEVKSNGINAFDTHNVQFIVNNNIWPMMDSMSNSCGDVG